MTNSKPITTKKWTARTQFDVTELHCIQFVVSSNAKLQQCFHVCSSFTDDLASILKGGLIVRHHSTINSPPQNNKWLRYKIWQETNSPYFPIDTIKFGQVEMDEHGILCYTEVLSVLKEEGTDMFEDVKMTRNEVRSHLQNFDKVARPLKSLRPLPELFKHKTVELTHGCVFESSRTQDEMKKEEDAREAMMKKWFKACQNNKIKTPLTRGFFPDCLKTFVPEPSLVVETEPWIVASVVNWVLSSNDDDDNDDA